MSSQARELEEDSAYNRTRALVGASNAARTQAEDRDFSRRVAFAEMGNGIKRDVMAGLGDVARGYGSLVNSYGSLSNNHGAMAAGYAQDYRDAAQGVGAGLYGLNQAYQSYQSRNATPATGINAEGTASGLAATPATDSLKQDGEWETIDLSTDSQNSNYRSPSTL